LKGRGKNEKISQVHGIHIKMRNVYRNSFKKNPQTKKDHFGIYFWKGSDNKTYPKEIGFNDTNWVYLVHDKNHSREHGNEH
jgi:hypothetical protein